ncbi:hypothetical protein QWC_31433 [Achromobacter marplatensis]|nr:hypothetical protein QWC_31433 [Achromobacter marplatensis]
MQLISRKALDEFDRQQHDKLIQDFAALHERHFAAPQASEAVRNADQDEMERLGWVNIGYKHDLEKARRAISFCNIPGFDTMSLDNAIYWLRANADKDGGDCAKGAEDVAMRDAAFEAVRKQLCKLPRYSFLSDAYGAVRLVGDRSGNWIEFNAAHALLDPVSVDAALSPTPPVVKQSLTATQTGEKGDSDAG